MKNFRIIFDKSNRLFKNLLKPKTKNGITINYIDNNIIESLCQEPKTKTTIAVEYGVDIRTLKKWLLDKGYILPKGLLCPNDLRIIYQLLGPPNIKHIKIQKK